MTCFVGITDIGGMHRSDPCSLKKGRDLNQFDNRTGLSTFSRNFQRRNYFVTETCIGKNRDKKYFDHHEHNKCHNYDGNIDLSIEPNMVPIDVLSSNGRSTYSYSVLIQLHHRWQLCLGATVSFKNFQPSFFNGHSIYNENLCLKV